MSPFTIFLVILVPCIWGIQADMLKIGLHQFPPIFMVSLRFLLMSLIMLPFVKGIRGKVAPALMVSATQGVAHFALLYIGFQYADVSTGIIAFQTNALFSVLLGALLLGERISLIGGVGIVTAFAGVALIVGAPAHGASVYGLGIIIVSALMFAIGNIVARRFGPMQPLALNATVALVSGPSLLCISLLMETGHAAALHQADWHAWGALLYTALAGGIAGYGIWYWLLSKHSVDQIAPFGLLMPFFAMVGSVVLLGEKLSWLNIVGALLTVFGVATSQFGGRVLAWLRPHPVPSKL